MLHPPPEHPHSSPPTTSSVAARSSESVTDAAPQTCTPGVIARIDDHTGEPDEPTVAFIETSKSDPLTIDDLEYLSAWLTAKVASVRAATATEGGTQ